MHLSCGCEKNPKCMIAKWITVFKTYDFNKENGPYIKMQM